MNVFYFEQAFKYRARKLYAQGVECLQVGAQKGEALCVFELYRTYTAGGWGLHPHKLQAEYYFRKAKLISHPILDFHFDKIDVLPVFDNETCALYVLEIQILMHIFEKTHSTDVAYKYLLKSNVASIIEYGARYCYGDANLFKMHWKPFLSMLKDGVIQKHQGCIQLCKNYHDRLNHPSYNTTICDIFGRDFHAVQERLERHSLIPVEMFLIGRSLYNGMIPMDKIWTTNGADNADKCLTLYLDRTSSYKEAVLAWILCAKQLKISKDVYLLIARLVWDARVPLLNG
jgi:hypothetical protein